MCFGGLYAVHNVNCQMEKEKITGIIGPNGAGKTTLFNMLTGLLEPTEGKISFHGHVTNGMKPHEIAKLGIARTFQNIRLFGNMTVLDNILVGMHCRTKGGCMSAIFRTRTYRQEEEKAVRKALDLLELLELSQHRYDLARSLPYGLQRKLEIARAMATGPEILLLDEPAAGMNEHETSDLGQFILKVRSLGFTIVLIEHDMQLVMQVCDKIYLLNSGELLAEGTPAEIKRNPVVIEAYLGKEDG